MRNKLEFTAGILNTVLAVFLFIEGIFFAIAAIVCLLMSFTIFFMAAIPLTVVLAVICAVSFGAAFAHIVLGAGSIIAAKKGGKITKILSAASVAADAAVIPANFLFACFLIYSFAVNVAEGNTDGLGLAIALLVFAIAAVLLAAASLIINIIAISRKNRESEITDI